jgi:DNA-binding NtrC family response regulator
MFMQPISILVVDDEHAFTEILAQRLEKRDFIVRTAVDGDAALKWLQDDEKIEVVILDIAMPGMNGIETLKAMKKDHPLIEVIMLTGQGAVDTAVESIKLGAFNYLLKPCEIQDLALFIQEALKRKRDREAKILEVRMKPYITQEERQEMIDDILAYT